MSTRYLRQMALPQIGSEGQDRLRSAGVLVVGAGGLGCAVLHYLSAAGVGRLGIVDPDRVELSNLHRQPLYSMSDIGVPKALAAARRVAAFNPDVAVEAASERVTPENAPRWCASADVVLDAGDSLALTYVLSDECRRQGRALVSASVLGLSGYAGVFCGGGPSYRAIFPEMPQRAGSCAEAGVLGTAVGVLGTVQAHLTLAHILRLDPPVLGRLVTVDLASLRFGGFSFAGVAEPAEPLLRFIAPGEVRTEDIVVDLRSRTEAPVSPFPGALRLSVEEVSEHGLPSGGRVVLCCRSGVRAWRAARALLARERRDVALIALGE